MSQSPQLRSIADIAIDGYAQVTPSDEYLNEITDVRKAAIEFFEMPVEAKKSFVGTRKCHGFRAALTEYASDPNIPDQNESFSVWSDMVDNPATMTPAMYDAMKTFFPACVRLANSLIGDISEGLCGERRELPFEHFSYIQINYVPATDETGPDRAIQGRHEDAHLITIHNATGRGAIAHLSGGELALPENQDVVTIFAGSTLTLMAGGTIPPLYHSVVAPLRREPRVSIMFFVNPDPTVPIEPFLENDSNKDIDISRHVNEAPLQFGLPALVDAL